MVDNQATADTLEVASRWKTQFPGRIRIIQEPKKGAASARNRGIIESRGIFVALLDSDDRMKPERLACQLEELRKDNAISLVGSWKNDVSPDGQTVVHPDAKPDIPRWAKYLFAHTERFKTDPLFEPQTSTFFFKKETALSIGLFDVRFDPFWLEDSEFVLRMYENGKVAIVPRSLIEFRLHSKKDANRRVYDFNLILKHDLFFSVLREKYFLKDDRLSMKGFKKLRSRWMRECGIKLLNLPHGETLGKQMILMAACTNPFNYKNWETCLFSMLPPIFHPKPFGIQSNPGDTIPDFVDSIWISRLFSLETPPSQRSGENVRTPAGPE